MQYYFDICSSNIAGLNPISFQVAENPAKKGRFLNGMGIALYNVESQPGQSGQAGGSNTKTMRVVSV